ncbi:hypothetical protein ACFO0N_17035 [Halobium salinum]|uniref:HPP family protein n=1 Tax=Halobium salinum TaxID=1364940 RepID=A0ABD5PFG6_9EURY|nr:hypothetical protein [Halobium salinum]
MNQTRRRVLFGSPPTKRGVFLLGLLSLFGGGLLLFALWMENETGGVVAAVALLAGATALLLAWADADDRVNTPVGPHALVGVGTAVVGLGFGLGSVATGRGSTLVLGLAALVTLHHVVRGAWIARTKPRLSDS